MKTIGKTLFYLAGLAACFALGAWYERTKTPAKESDRNPALRVANHISQANPNVSSPPTASGVTSSSTPAADATHAYVLAETDPRAALEAAMKLPESARLAALQNIMAAWLRKDRLAAAEWMTEKRGLREFEPLSAQVSDAFFPDDTEMCAMFCFNLSDASLRDERVNKLVAYWKSGAHLKFDNSPWETVEPAASPANGQAGPVPAPLAEKNGG